MRINFLLPFINKTGGLAVLVEHARGLGALGHDIALYYPLLPFREFLAEEKSLFRKYVLGQVKPLCENILRYRREITWASPPVPIIPVPILAPSFIRDADVTLASAWPTAYSVAALPRSKGRKFYFIQHYETWSSDVSLVDASYRLPLEIITIAPWLSELMRTRFGREVRAEIHNGIDLVRFRAPAWRDWSRPAILMMHHDVEWKGVKDGLEVLAAIHARHPEVPIRMFGLHAFPDRPAWVEFHRDPPPEKLVELYQKSTLFLGPSHKEGWHLPPMEAMACGCAVVATDVGCIPVLREEGNMRVAAPHDKQALQAHLEELLTAPELCRATAERGLATISRYTWKRATARLNEALA